MLIPATIASAWIVLPAQTTTATPAAIHPSPTRTASAGFPAFLAATSSLTPVARKAPATNNTSASSEVNGLSVRTTPTTAHTTPSNRRAQGRVTRNYRVSLRLSRRYATPQTVTRQAARIQAPKRANCAPV